VSGPRLGTFSMGRNSPLGCSSGVVVQFVGGTPLSVSCRMTSTVSTRIIERLDTRPVAVTVATGGSLGRTPDPSFRVAVIAGANHPGWVPNRTLCADARTALR
jgi:hypothetical protein